MITRLQKCVTRERHARLLAKPPSDDDKRFAQKASLFVGERFLRPLRVAIDAELVPQESPTDYSHAHLLSGLLGHPYIEFVQYSDHGPPSFEVRDEDSWPHAQHWILMIDPRREDASRNFSYTYSNQRAIFTARPQDLLQQVREGNGPFSFDDVSNSAENRVSDYLAVMTVEAANADIYVTRRGLAAKIAHRHASDVDVLTPESALSIVSLYLRSQGVYLIRQTWKGGSHSYSKGLYYWVATRDLLPAGWAYFSHCVYAEAEAGGPSPLHLGQSVLQRLERCIKERDRVHIALNQPQNNDVADEIATALDAFLFSLLGAFDAAARVAHLALQIPSPIRSAGWQKRGWLKAVARAYPPLAEVLAEGRDETHCLYIIVILRNSVHGEALQTVTTEGARAERQSTLIGLPNSELEELNKRMAEVADLSTWGVRQILRETAHVDAGLLIDQLLPLAAKSLNTLMCKTPTDRLRGANRSPAGGPDLETDRIFGSSQRFSIRSQLGLE